MKKLTMLTSCLALAACFGGGGNGVTSGAPARSAVSQTTIDSNKQVTAMASEILIDEGGNATARSATRGHARAGSIVQNGQTYTSYRLEDIKLRPADMSVPANAYLKIGVDDNGRIDKMTMVMGTDANNKPIGGDLARDFNSDPGKARFEGPIFEYVRDRYAKDGDNEFSVANTHDAMLDRVATKRGFTGGHWITNSGNYVYELGAQGSGNYQTFDPDGAGPLTSTTFSIAADTASVQDAVKAEYHFNDGKWVSDGNNYKYVEYGDEAEYRIAAAGVTQATLNSIVTREELPSLGHWNRVNEVMEVDTFGRDIDGAGTSLQYADFGHFNPVYREKLVELLSQSGGTWTAALTKTQDNDKVNDELAGKDYQMFAGGYAVKTTGATPELVDTLDAPTAATYTGKAKGRVYVSFQSNGLENRSDYLEYWDVPHDDGSSYSNNAGHDIAADFTTTNAQLTVADGVQTLSMPFGTDNSHQFYDVTVTQNVDGTGLAFNFNDVADPDNNPDVHWMSDSQYRQTVQNAATSEKAFKPGYYGIDTPTEAAGTAFYNIENDIGGIGVGTGSDDISRQWEFQAAYGTKKNP